MPQIKIITRHGYEVALDDDESSIGKLKRIALDIIAELGAAPDHPAGFEAPAQRVPWTGEHLTVPPLGIRRA